MVFKNLADLFINVFNNIKSLITVHAGTNIFVKLIFVLIVMIAVFFVGHYFWNLISLLPLNLVMSYLLYQFTESKILIAVFWLTYIPWCIYMEDVNRCTELVSPDRRMAYKAINHSFSLWPIGFNRYIRWWSMALTNAAIYCALLFYFVQNTVLQASNKALFTITLVIMIVFFTLFVLTIVCQPVDIFKNSGMYFDNLIDEKRCNKISQNNKGLTNDEVMNILNSKKKKTGIISGIVRIVVYIIAIIIIIVNATFKINGIAGSYAFVPLFFVICIIWCIYAQSHLEKL